MVAIILEWIALVTQSTILTNITFIHGYMTVQLYEHEPTLFLHCSNQLASELSVNMARITDSVVSKYI